MLLAASWGAIQLKKQGFGMRVDDDDVASKCLADVSRHVIGCHLNRETRSRNALDDLGPGRYSSPRHRVPCNSRNEGSNALDDVANNILPDVARYVVGCHLTHGTRVQSALDDVASSVCQAILPGAVLVYDVCDRKSFEKLGDWLDESRKFG